MHSLVRSCEVAVAFRSTTPPFASKYEAVPIELRTIVVPNPAKLVCYWSPSCADNSIEPQHLKHCLSTASYGTRFRDVKLIPCLTLHLMHTNRSIIIVGQKVESGPNRAEKSKCSISSYFISIS